MAKKKETLAAWRAMAENQPIVKHVRPVKYKAKGSRYGACGIRIDGTPAFVDAVLSHLKELLVCENGYTRLELARHEVDGSGIGKALPNAVMDAEVCYIRVHERGHEARMVNAVFGLEREATMKFAEALEA